MSDLISRQAAIDSLEEERYPCESDYDEGYLSMLDKAIWIIKEWLPSAQPEKRTDKRTETHACDSVNRQDAIDAAVEAADEWDGGCSPSREAMIGAAIRKLPSAQPDYQEVLGWLLAYHTKSFDLHGRYLPHEVISWLINDFTKEFIAERRTDG